MSGLGAAGTAALLGGVAALPRLVVSSDSLGAMILLCLAQLPLFGAGLWLGVQASLITAAVRFMMLLASGNLLIATTFAGLNASPVVLLVRQALLAREGTGDGIAWCPSGQLSAWLTGLGLAVAAVVVVVVRVLGGVDDICVALRHPLASAIDSGLDVSAEGLDEVLNSVAVPHPPPHGWQ